MFYSHQAFPCIHSVFTKASSGSFCSSTLSVSGWGTSNRSEELCEPQSQHQRGRWESAVTPKSLPPNLTPYQAWPARHRSTARPNTMFASPPLSWQTVAPPPLGSPLGDGAPESCQRRRLLLAPVKRYSVVLQQNRNTHLTFTRQDMSSLSTFGQRLS